MFQEDPASHACVQTLKQLPAVTNEHNTQEERERRRRKSLQTSMTEFWVCFSCCVADQPQPKRRRRIDRTMIGEPTNFIHMTHVGSGDMGVSLGAVDSVQSQMKSKGGYVNGTAESVQG